MRFSMNKGLTALFFVIWLEMQFLSVWQVRNWLRSILNKSTKLPKTSAVLTYYSQEKSSHLKGPEGIRRIFQSWLSSIKPLPSRIPYYHVVTLTTLFIDCKTVRANSQTKVLKLGWKQRARLGRDAKNIFFLSLHMPVGRVRLARFAD